MQLKLEYSEVWVWAMSVGVNYDKDSMWKFHFQMNTHVIVSGPFNDKPRISYVYLQDNVIILYCLFFMISVICAIKHLDFQLRARVLGLWRRLAGVPLNHSQLYFVPLRCWMHSHSLPAVTFTSFSKEKKRVYLKLSHVAITQLSPWANRPQTISFRPRGMWRRLDVGCPNLLTDPYKHFF